MNQLVAMSVMQGLINGGKYSTGYVRTAARCHPNIWDRNDMSSLAVRMMVIMRSYSSYSESVPEKVKEKEEKGIVVSSYWGISRPKITKEDGSAWPWNCFMVTVTITITILISVIVVNFLTLLLLLLFLIFCVALGNLSGRFINWFEEAPCAQNFSWQSCLPDGQTPPNSHWFVFSGMLSFFVMLFPTVNCLEKLLTLIVFGK